MNRGQIMVIAGTDSSGGAGLTRDTAVANLLGFDVLPVVTAVTVQTHAGLIDAELMSPDLVGKQIDAAFASGSVQAIKIGMLGSREVAKWVAGQLRQCAVPKVIDPVLKTSSGGSLMSGDLPEDLLLQSDLVTPNLLESAALTKRSVAKTEAEIAAQAKAVLSAGVKAVLIKGGHGAGANSVDYLFETAGQQRLAAQRLKTDRRGTGCTLATAIACQLAAGQGLADACRSAKRLVHLWLEGSSDKPHQ